MVWMCHVCGSDEWKEAGEYCSEVFVTVRRLFEWGITIVSHTARSGGGWGGGTCCQKM
jgi:hypothetical protein